MKPIWKASDAHGRAHVQNPEVGCPVKWARFQLPAGLPIAILVQTVQRLIVIRFGFVTSGIRVSGSSGMQQQRPAGQYNTHPHSQASAASVATRDSTSWLCLVCLAGVAGAKSGPPGDVFGTKSADSESLQGSVRDFVLKTTG